MQSIREKLVFRRLAGVTLLVLWATLSIACLAQFVYSCDQNAELEELLVLQLSILNFPSSLVWLAIDGISPFWFLDLQGPFSYWVLFTFLGFVQWFLFVPLALRCGKALLFRIATRLATRHRGGPGTGSGSV